MSRLEKTFYERTDVVQISKELIGKVLYTSVNGKVTAGAIIETEAYAGAGDKASHAYGLRRTARNEAMYGPGGTAYVFLCYGIHRLFNVVTNVKEVPHAVLIRALQPVEGIELMLERRKLKKADKRLSGGPGTLSQAMGIDLSMNAADLSSELVWIEDHRLEINPSAILTTARIGIAYAGEDALLPYRFVYKDKINT